MHAVLTGAGVPRAFAPDDATPVEIDLPIVTADPDSDGGECDRAWLTLPQLDVWDALSDRYPHAELTAGPAVRIGGLTEAEYRLDILGDLDVPLKLDVWQAVFAPVPFVLIDLDHKTLTGA